MNVLPEVTVMPMLNASTLLVDSNASAQLISHSEMVSQAALPILMTLSLPTHQPKKLQQHLHQLPVVVFINDFNCAGQGMLSQIANVASDVNISCFGSSCGVQCVDSSKSPNVSGVFCQ